MKWEVTYYADEMVPLAKSSDQREKHKKKKTQICETDNWMLTKDVRVSLRMFKGEFQRTEA